MGLPTFSLNDFLLCSRKAPPAAIAAVPEKRKLKPVKRKAALASKENLTPEEKKLKRDAQEHLDKQVRFRMVRIRFYEVTCLTTGAIIERKIYT